MTDAEVSSQEDSIPSIVMLIYCKEFELFIIFFASFALEFEWVKILKKYIKY